MLTNVNIFNLTVKCNQYTVINNINLKCLILSFSTVFGIVKGAERKKTAALVQSLTLRTAFILIWLLAPERSS